MKNVIIILFITFFSLAGFATNTPSVSGEEKEKIQLAEKIKSLVGDSKLFDALGLSGEANVIISIDENEIIHVESVETSDVVADFHIRKSLEGAKLDVENSFIGKTINIVINFMQSEPVSE